jgi:hypothetical protein
MNLLELVRKGLRFLLMSMGISSPESKKPLPGPRSGTNP